MNNAHSLINQLIQLQELIAAKMQKKVSMQNARLDELENSIAALSSDLSPSVKTHINRLLQKNPEAIVAVVNGNCSGCGMALTKSLVQAVIKAENLSRCPNCTRFLFEPAFKIERDKVTRQYGEIHRGKECLGHSLPIPALCNQDHRIPSVAPQKHSLPSPAKH